MPITRRALPLAAVAAAALAVAGCSIADDGPEVTQTRDVAEFSRIDNRASVDVRLHVGAAQRVRVRAGEKVVGDVHTDVRDGTLRVTFDHHGIGGGNVVVDAWVPRLTGVVASGSGDVTGSGVAADALDVRSDGSGDVALRGTAGRLSLGLDGSGDADLGDLEAREAQVSVGGSGDADVRARERLIAVVDGSGDVHYHGDPAVTRRVDGSGDVSRAG
jgi:hypothetical protein